MSVLYTHAVAADFMGAAFRRKAEEHDNFTLLMMAEAYEDAAADMKAAIQAEIDATPSSGDQPRPVTAPRSGPRR